MNYLDTSYISDAQQMPIKQGTLDFLQGSHKDTVSQVIKGLIGIGGTTATYNANLVYILWGCSNDSNNSNYYNLKEGAVFYQGEVFYVAAANNISAPANWNLVITPVTATNADPVTFTSGAKYSVHNIRTMNLTSNGSTGVEFTSTDTIKLYIDQNNINTTIQNLQNQINNLQNFIWNYVPTSGAGSYKGGYSGTLRYGKDSLGWVHLEGTFKASNTGSSVIFTLPAGYIPDRDIAFTMIKEGAAVFSSRNYAVALFINTDGTVNDSQYGNGGDNQSSYYVTCAPYKAAS